MANGLRNILEDTDYPIIRAGSPEQFFSRLHINKLGSGFLGRRKSINAFAYRKWGSICQFPDFRTQNFSLVLAPDHLA